MRPAADRFVIDALKTVITSDNRPIFHYLLACCGSISDETRGHIVEYATLYGRIEMVQAVLITVSILETHRASTLILAGQAGNLAFLNLLLSNGPISQEYLKNTMKQAASSGHLPIIESLLTCGAVVSQEALEETLVKAAMYSHLAMIERLLADGAEISETARSEAVLLSIQNAHMPCFNVLMASGPISQEKRGFAVFKAVQEGHYLAFQTLLTSGPISDIDRGTAIRIAFMNHHIEFYLPLMTSGAITSDDRDEILTRATEAGELAIVQTLFASGPTSNVARFNCMGESIIRERLDILEVILGHSTDLPIELRGPLVRNAAQRGHLAMIQILLASGPITQDYLVAAINITPEDRLDIRELLIDGVISAATPSRIRVSPSVLKNTPSVYLEDIAAYGLRSIRFLNPDGSEQPGIDAGGLTKQFIHQLIQSLQAKGVLNINDFRIPTCTEDAICRNTFINRI